MFRLNYLKLEGHQILKDIEMSFCPNDAMDQMEFFSTIVIGQNGTGKSNILKVVSEIFRAFDLYKADETKKPDIRYAFHLIYTLDNNIYEIVSSKLMPMETGSNYGYFYFRNTTIDTIEENIIQNLSLIHKYTIHLDELELPVKVLASSLMLTDKFNAKSYGIYKYLGVRNENTPSSTGTRTYIRKTVDSIIDGIKQKNFAEELKKLFIFLELDPVLTLSYVPRYNRIFYKEDITVEDLNQAFIENWEQLFPRRNTPIWGVNYFNKIKENKELLTRVVEFLKKVHRKVYIEGDRRSIKYDVINSREIIDDYDMIQILRHLDIISYPELSVSRFSKIFDFISSSSGETHMISEFIGILSQIQENSLILIDEPEISLHPNWQMKYIDQLREIFHNYPSAHFVIATHSHFLLSGIPPELSNVIILDRDINNNISCQSIDFNTYGWSPDDILYNVFGVVSSRNKFVAEDIANILDELSKGDKNSINQIDRDKYHQLINLENSLKDNDPLKEVVKSILKKVHN